MASHTLKLLANTAEKVGVNDEKIINQAAEFIRELRTKQQFLSISEMNKITMCLELASLKYGGKFDKQKMVTVSNRNYNKDLMLIKNVLQLDINKSIKEICIQLSCEECAKMAESLLKLYKEKDLINTDFSHPQYSTVAVYAACKLNKITVSKKDFITMSTLTTKQWAGLTAVFLKFAEDNDFKSDLLMKGSKKNGTEFMDIVDQKVKELDLGKEKEEIRQKKVIESYESWRERILKEAYEKINQ